MDGSDNTSNGSFKDKVNKFLHTCPIVFYTVSILFYTVICAILLVLTVKLLGAAHAGTQSPSEFQRNLNDFKARAHIDQCIEYNNNVSTVCYSSKLHRVVYAYYTVGRLASEIHRAKRMSFYVDKNVDNISQNVYVGSNYDKGHLAPDASFDHDEKLLKSTYNFTLNTVPMFSRVNRYQYLHVEKYIRELSKSHDVYVIDYNTASDNFLGPINIPRYLYKIITYNGSTECFMFDNLDPEKNVKPYNIKCDYAAFN